jgi:hypothetical protein
MTKEEMIELAKQAGWQYAHGESGYEALWAFGKLVAEKEREACAKRLEAVGRQHCTEVYSFVHYLIEKAIQAKGQE